MHGNFASKVPIDGFVSCENLKEIEYLDQKLSEKSMYFYHPSYAY